MTGTDRYRVVQWATGNIGSHSLRAVIAHPNLDLVGLYVYSEDKAGRDAGELCGMAPTGVLATRDIDGDPCPPAGLRRSTWATGWTSTCCASCSRQG